MVFQKPSNFTGLTVLLFYQLLDLPQANLCLILNFIHLQSLSDRVFFMPVLPYLLSDLTDNDQWSMKYNRWAIQGCSTDYTLIYCQISMRTGWGVTKKIVMYIHYSLSCFDSIDNSSIFYHLLINIYHYYMVLSHKDCELPNSRIWLADIDIESGLDFPI